MTSKVITKISILMGTIACLVVLCFIFMYCYLGYRVIPVKYITSLDCAVDADREEHFYAMFTVETAKEWIQQEGMNKRYHHPERLLEALNELDDNQRVVLAIGKRIKYFYYSDEGSSPDVFAVYYDEPVKDRVYFYTVDYNGSMIDYDYL